MLLAQKIVKIDRTYFVSIMIIDIVQWMWSYRWLWRRLQQNMKYFFNSIFPWLRIIITYLDYISLLVFEDDFFSKTTNQMIWFCFLFYKKYGISNATVKKISNQWNFDIWQNKIEFQIICWIVKENIHYSFKFKNSASIYFL